MEKLKTLLDRVYELEGLIHLALSRNDGASARIASLIAAKGEAVSRAMADFEMTAIPSDAESPEGPNPLAEAEEFIAYSLEEEESTAENLISDTLPEPTDREENDGDIQPGETVSYQSPESDGDSLSEEAGDSISVDEKNSETLVQDGQHADPVENDRQKPHNLRTLFSINDRFRFARELFGGSTRRFDDSLAYLDGAIDLNEVEDFFVGEQGFDPESEVVKEFLDTLSRAFAD